jgi:hypothetical protein
MSFIAFGCFLVVPGELRPCLLIFLEQGQYIKDTFAQVGYHAFTRFLSNPSYNEKYPVQVQHVKEF